MHLRSLTSDQQISGRPEHRVGQLCQNYAPIKKFSVTPSNIKGAVECQNPNTFVLDVQLSFESNFVRILKTFEI